jgi:transposase, IS30 family
MPYTQTTSEKRYALSVLRKQGCSQSAIARALDRHPSTISREQRRNAWRCNGRAYVPSRGQSHTNERRRRSRRNSQFSTAQWALVESALREDFSPAQVVGWFARCNLLAISHETIYRHIWTDKAVDGTLHVHLRRANKRVRKRYGAYDSRWRLAGKRHISTRPASAANRSRIGHREVDTALGASQGGACIVTLVERKTSFVVIGKLKRCAASDLNTRLERLVRRQPRVVRTITADTGTEFHSDKAFEAHVPLTFCFATPHHSWERGFNENMKGLIRQYLTKGVSMEHLTQADSDRIADKLNRRPRKRYDWRAPQELYDKSNRSVRFKGDFRRHGKLKRKPRIFDKRL